MNNRAFELRKQGQETLNRPLKPFKLKLSLAPIGQLKRRHAVQGLRVRSD